MFFTVIEADMFPAVFLMLALAAVEIVADAPHNAPRLVFEAKTVRLDTMTQGETREIVFKFLNKGRSVLVIDHTRSSCGCTLAFSTKKKIPADSGGVITVKFSSMQFRGAKTKSVYVYSNDPDRPIDTLTFHVFVRSEIDCAPRNIALENVVKGVPVTATVALFNPGTVPITVTGLRSPESFIKPNLVCPVTVAPGDTVRAEIVITPPDSSTAFGGTIGVFTKGGVTDHPFSIKVYGKYKK